MENEKSSLNGVSGTWTDAQRKLLFKLMQENDLKTEDMEESLNFPMSDLSVREASQLIDCLKNKGNLSDVIGQIKEKRDNQSEPSNLNVPKSPEEAQIIRSRKSEFQVEPGSELALAKTAGIPEEMANLFFMKLNGTAYIKVAGLQFMAGKVGYRRIETNVNFDEKTKTWVAEAKIYPKITESMLNALSKLSPEVQKDAYADMAKPTNGIGTASPQNVQNARMQPFMREMAQTRALGRALRSYTGYGSTTYEELPDAVVEGEQ